MILKIINEKDTIAGIRVYENNFDGKVEVQDTYHLKVISNGFDDIFGTNEEQITIIIKKEEL